MKQYEFRLEFFDRIELRSAGTDALDRLNAMGKQGWHIVHIKDDPQHARDLAVFLEREISAA